MFKLPTQSPTETIVCICLVCAFLRPNISMARVLCTEQLGKDMLKFVASYWRIKRRLICLIP